MNKYFVKIMKHSKITLMGGKVHFFPTMPANHKISHPK